MICSRGYIREPACKIRQIKSPKETELFLAQAHLIPSCKQIDIHVTGFMTEVVFV